jgi:hypothetical protein
MMNEKRFYIVVGWLDNAGAMGLGNNILWHSSEGTLFNNRSDAVNALNRTKRYAKFHGLGWELNRCYIQKVKRDE